MCEASRLVLLEQLHSIATGTKVRFLGSVYAYDVHSAHITLRDRYPARSKDAPTVILAIEHVLETLNHELLQTGAWLNVMGYVMPMPETPSATTECKPKGSKRSPKKAPSFVEATMIWSAGAIKLSKYASAVAELQTGARPDD